MRLRQQHDTVNCCQLVCVGVRYRGINKHKPTVFGLKPKKGIPWERFGEGARFRQLERVGPFFFGAVTLAVETR